MALITPITLTWSPLFAGYYTLLSARVIRIRRGARISLGDGTPTADAKEKSNDLPSLQKAIRAHGNFQEYTPITLILILMAELNGANSAFVHGALASLFASRVAHCEFGLAAKWSIGRGRVVGMVGTLTIILATAVYNFILAQKGP